MFWKKEVKDKELDLSKSISPSLDALTAKIDKINAKVDFLMESKKVDTERFTRVNEQIGELRGSIVEREKQFKSLEAEAIKASELVKAVQPEKLMAKVEKEDVKVEILKAKLEAQEKISKNIIQEIKGMKTFIKAFKGIEEVIQLNQETTEDISTAKKILTDVDIKASKVERLFIDFNKQYANLTKMKENSEKIKMMYITLKKEFDAIKIQISSLGKLQEVMDVESSKSIIKKEVTILLSEKEKMRILVAEMKGLLEEIKKSEENTKENKERVEKLFKESQQRQIIFQDLFLQFQKTYQNIAGSKKKKEDVQILKGYIQESIRNNVKKSEIKAELMKRGWPHEIIDEYL